MALLFIQGGADFARRAYTAERRGYWAAAFPLMLEKHGHLNLEIAGGEALQDPTSWASHDVVLIARMPRDAWTQEAVDIALDGPTPVLVEGPLPPELKDRLGLVTSGGAAENGTLLAASDELSNLSLESYGVAPGGPVVRPDHVLVSRAPEHDWMALSRVPISPLLASTWRTPGWQVEFWRSDDEHVEVLAQWERWGPSNTRTPAIVRRGNLYACAVSIFSFLGQAHTAEPADGAQHSRTPRIFGVETLLLGLIDLMYRRAERCRARLLPWPGGISWIRSVRHDFDRALTVERVAHLVAEHARVGSTATWYWRSEPRAKAARSLRHEADLRAAELVAASPGHEVALHTELLWSEAEEEQGMVETAIRRKVLGTTAHGASNCFRFQGAPNILWAEQRGMLYTEFLYQGHLHPHRCAVLMDDGEIKPLEVICLPNHASFDASTTASNRKAVEGWIPLFVATRGLLQIMNHPDVNHEELFDALAAMPDEGRADWTAAEAASWWRRTHSHDRVGLQRIDDSTFEVTAGEPIERLAVEILAPDGLRREEVVDVVPGAPTRVGLGDSQRVSA